MNRHQLNLPQLYNEIFKKARPPEPNWARRQDARLLRRLNVSQNSRWGGLRLPDFRQAPGPVGQVTLSRGEEKVADQPTR